MPERWPFREQVASTIRTILRREFGAQDAWVVTGRDGVRLEARARDRTLVLLRAPEPEFWARFYRPVRRARRRLGLLTEDVVTWRKSGGEVAEILRPLWEQARSRASAE